MPDQVTTIATGNRRLLRLAAILDTVKRYNQEMYAFKCGTPACALGHWAASHPRRFVLKNEDVGGVIWTKTQPSVDIYFTSQDVLNEFFLTEDESRMLFSPVGCGRAKTAKAAAAFIREFVAGRAKQAASGVR